MKYLVLAIFIFLSVVNTLGQNNEDSLINRPMIIFMDAQLPIRHIVGTIAIDDSLPNKNKEIEFHYYCGAITIKNRDMEYLQRMSSKNISLHLMFDYIFFNSKNIPYLEKSYYIKLAYLDLMSHPVIMITNDKYYDKYYYDIYAGHITSLMMAENKKDKKLIDKSRRIIVE